MHYTLNDDIKVFITAIVNLHCHLSCLSILVETQDKNWC